MDWLRHGLQHTISLALACLLFFISPSVLAITIDVSNNNDSGADSLRAAISAANNGDVISFTGNFSKINLASDLPSITANITIQAPANQIIDGLGSSRIFSTNSANLVLTNLSLQNGRARGTNGNSDSGGGGGGLGAGGGVYVDLGRSLTLNNTTITGCTALGGNGGSGFSGTRNGASGGGASFGARVQGGAFGYGGGNVSSNTVAAGAPAGNASGTNGGTAGSGGYCAGGGGNGNGTGGGGNGGGAGGGGGNGPGGGSNGSTNGFGTAGAGGNGGNFGSPGTGGGATGAGYSAGGGGGGGGFGAGGGSGGSTYIPIGSYVSAGNGGGGGFGGGGAGGGGGNFGGGAAGTGGFYGGNGGNGAGGGGAGGGGGGGAGIGGGIFVGDGSTLVIGNGVNIANNTAFGGSPGTGGSPGIAGSGYANDIFLFQFAQLQFNNTSNLTLSSAIEGDTAAPANRIDSGVSKTSGAGVVTLNSGVYTYRGGTNVSAGGLIVNNATLPTTGNVAIAGGASLSLNTNTAATTGTFNNAGFLNLGATFNRAHYTSFTNTGAVYLTGSGNFLGNLTTGTSLNIGKDSFGNASGKDFSTSSTITIPLVNVFASSSFTPATGSVVTATNFNVYNNSYITTSGGSIAATNLFMVGASSVGGTVSGTTFTVGEDSSAVADAGSSVSLTSNMSNFTNISVKRGTLKTNGFSLSGFTLADIGINGTITNAVLRINTNDTVTIANTRIMNLWPGSSINSNGNLVINGTLNIKQGASFALNSGGTGVTGAATGVILNDGSLSIDSTGMTFGGAITNRLTGVFAISGTAVVNLNNGFTNAGTMLVSFNQSNSLPIINTLGAVTLAGGDIIINYTNNYIAAKTYPLISSNAAIATVGNAQFPPTNTYITSWSLVPDYTIGATHYVGVAVTRSGFDVQAIGAPAKSIGAFLETIGQGTPTQAQVDLLNALEKITDPTQLTEALLGLLPAVSSQLHSFAASNRAIGIVESQLATVRNEVELVGVAAGDPNASTGVWIRPFNSTGSQKARANLPAYTDTCHGVAFGVDNKISPWVTLGLAGSASKSVVNQQPNTSSQTNISSYQAMIYGTFKPVKNSYLDWVMAGGVNNYKAVRTSGLTGFTTPANAEYAGQLFSLKALYGHMFPLKKYLQLTPMASAQYTYLRQDSYTETGSGAYNTTVNIKNGNLFRLGVGGKLGMPFRQEKLVVIPNIQGMVLMDVKGGAQDSDTQFVSGGPIMTNTVQQAKATLKYGASLELSFDDSLQLIFNYDLELKRGFKGHTAYANLRYVF